MGSRSMTIAQLHWGFPPTIGGVETHMSILLPELVARGHRQWVFTSTVEGVDKRMNFHGVEVIHSSVMDLSRVARTDSGITEEQVAKELKAFLKPLPAKPIEEVLKSFETVDGLRMELVAREPLVHDPIAGAFDEHGNLYVCEMRDYPFNPCGIQLTRFHG